MAAKSQAEYVEEIVAGEDGAAITEVHCGFREDEGAEPCGCEIEVEHAQNIKLKFLSGLEKEPWKVVLRDIEKAGGFLCDEHIALLKEAGCLPEMILTTRQINELGSRRRNEALREDNEGAMREAAEERERKLNVARSFAAATFRGKQKPVPVHKSAGGNGHPVNGSVKKALEEAATA